MRPGRLLLTLYIGVIVIVFVAAGLFLQFQLGRTLPGDDNRAISKHILSDLGRLRDQPAKLHAELAELADAHIDVSIYTPDHRLLASNIDPPLAIGDSGRHQRWVLTLEVDDGGHSVLIGTVQQSRPELARVLARIGVMFGLLVLLVIVIARQVGVPMQRIAGAARRFGLGDLQARARIQRNDELGEVGRAFDEMADRVTTLMTAQRELMANVSHELQTPIARIQVAVDLIVDGIDDRAKDILPDVAKDLAELERLIDDVMTLSRFDLASTQGRTVATPLRTEPIAITELVDKATTRFHTHHPERAIIVTTDPGMPVLELDPMLVRRVIENLLDNARKYSEPDTTISITASTTGTSITIAVTDRGIGMEPADLRQLFTPFFRTDRSRTRTTGGSGLGLVLARRVVEAHGGTIVVHSEAGQGTTVAFQLPVA